MNYRIMRLLLFFDLPVEKSSQRHDYSVFVRNIKKTGFYMLQESVYVKLCLDVQSAKSVIANVRTFSPKDGSIFVLTITENQFASIDLILGDSVTDVINNDERLIEL